MKILCSTIMITIFTWILASGYAIAQDHAKAEALFNWGVEAMEAGRYDVACSALAESQRLDPLPGVLVTLADCNDRAGKIATAAALYSDYLRSVAQMQPEEKARHERRATWAAKRKTALLPEVPTLTLTLPSPLPTNLLIKLDNTDLTAASVGVPLPLDPGKHLLTTQVGRGPVVEQRVVLARRDRQTLEIVIKLPQPDPPARPATEEAKQPAIPRAVTPISRANRALEAGAGSGAGTSGRRIGAVLAGGIGVAGLAVGVVTGVMVLEKKSIIEAHCSGSTCDAEGKAAGDSASVPGAASTAGFCLGGAGLATGLLLWLTEPSQPKAGTAMHPVHATVSADGTNVVVGMKGVW